MSQDDRLSAVSAFMRALTPASVALLGAVIVIGVVGYAVFEARATVAATLLASPLAIGGLVLALITVLAGVSFSAMLDRALTRSENSSREREQGMQKQIDALAEQNRDQGSRLRQLQDQNNRQADQLTECHKGHANALREMARLAAVIAKADRA